MQKTSKSCYSTGSTSSDHFHLNRCSSYGKYIPTLSRVFNNELIDDNVGEPLPHCKYILYDNLKLRFTDAIHGMNQRSTPYGSKKCHLANLQCISLSAGASAPALRKHDTSIYPIMAFCRQQSQVPSSDPSAEIREECASIRTNQSKSRHLKAHL